MSKQWGGHCDFIEWPPHISKRKRARLFRIIDKGHGPTGRSVPFKAPNLTYNLRERIVNRNKRTRLLKASASGFVAGLAGAWAMIEFTRLWNRLLPQDGGQDPRQRHYSQQEWDATSRLAEVMGSPLFGRPLSQEERQAGASFLHYAIGGAVGAVYGAVAEFSPGVSRLSGMLFGFSVWVAADEVLMPALGVSRPLNHYSCRMQVNALGEHIAYGLTTEALRRML